MKVSQGEQITFVLQITDADKASGLCGKLLNTHLSRVPYEGVIVNFSGRTRPGEDNPIEQGNKDNELLNEIAEYLSRNHLGDEEAEALLDKIEQV